MSCESRKHCRESRTAVCVCLGLLMLSGCANSLKMHEKVAQVEREGIDILVYDEGVRTTYLKQPADTEYFCSAPQADVADDFGGSLSLGVATAGAEDAVGDSAGESSLALGGRSPAVLITRELMYRACELALNVGANKQETLQIYQLFLDSIVKVSAGLGSSPGSGVASSAVTGYPDAPSGSGDTDPDSDDAGSGSDDSKKGR